MALNFCWLSVFYVVFWITTPNSYVYASKDWSVPYTSEGEVTAAETETELRLLDDSDTGEVVRHRRYVPDSLGPLDEYIHRNDKLLTTRDLQDALTPRQTETKPASSSPDVPPPGLSENSAARPPTPPPPPSPTTNTLPLPQNKSGIIAAYFDNATTSSASPTDDLPLSNYNDEMINSTMQQHNLSIKREDHHIYYNSSFLVDTQVGQSYWVDMSKRDDVKVNNMLSKSHRRAATVKLSFEFPFYGHPVRNVTIATGGFLYTGDYVHSWLAATQYIAPLMANFDTSITNHSYIKYLDNGTAFTVQWERVVLQDKPSFGEFTFQVTLHSRGDIVFVYQNVPIIVENIQDDQHPVKVGLSDAYIIDRTIFFVRRKTIYEYHRVNFNKEDIKNWTVIYMSALPTCMEQPDCHSCVSANIGFECKWCPSAGRCSTGMDRKRQDWLYNECERLVVSSPAQCDTVIHHDHPSASAAAAAAASPQDTDVPSEWRRTGPTAEEGGKIEESSDSVRAGQSSSYLGAGVIIVLIAAVAVWAMYAYSNPHSYSGQMLIKYRPSQWSWRRGEARYTAATIHM